MKNIFKVIVVDDVIEHQNRIIRQLEQLKLFRIEIIGVADSLSSAKKLIIKYKGEFHFIVLDMQLKDSFSETGFDLLDEVHSEIGEIPFGVIVNTIYPQDFAVDWVNLSKDYSEFIGFVVKWEWKGKSFEEQLTDMIEKFHVKTIKLILNASKVNKYVLADTICFVKSDDSISFAHLRDSKYICSQPLRYFKEHLPKPLFFLCHQSYLINVRKIEAFRNSKPNDKIKPKGGFAIMKNGAEIPISNLDNRRGLEKLI